MDDISHAFEALYLSHHDIGQARRLACEHPEFSSSEDQCIAVLMHDFSYLSSRKVGPSRANLFSCSVYEKLRRRRRSPYSKYLCGHLTSTRTPHDCRSKQTLRELPTSCLSKTRPRDPSTHDLQTKCPNIVHKRILQVSMLCLSGVG
jgi:hypothetical protein